ncbi:MAG: hypothetical protein IKV03_05955 [Alphaproteobacteria bacterium]|nr:hypothetical protein [Alphaproteobacteria bacterium]
MGMLRDLFGSKKRNSPDVLGRYPEYMQVRALPERRYLKTSRLLAAFILVNLGITLALSGIYTYMAERVDVSIVSRKAVSLFYIDTEKKRLLPAEHAQRTFSATQFVVEGLLEQYIKERHTILADKNKMERIWGRYGIVSRLSSKAIWKPFISSASRDLELMQQKGRVRDVHLYELEYVHEDMWQAIIDVFDMPLPDEFNPLCNECLDNSQECIKCKKEHALDRKRYKVFIRTSFGQAKDVINPLGVMVYSYHVVPMVARDNSFWDTPRALKPEL